MIKCPYCDRTFPDDYYWNVHVPCPERRGDRRIGTIAAAGFVAAEVAANITTSRFGLIPVGFGFVATAGTYFAGITYVLRDTVQDRLGRWVVVGLIMVGAIVSFLMANHAIAIASGVAFLVSELADLAVYTPLRSRGYVRAAVASNVVGAFVDTVLFLTLAGFPVWASVPGQMIAKLAITLVAVAAVTAYRVLSRQPHNA